MDKRVWIAVVACVLMVGVLIFAPGVCRADAAADFEQCMTYARGGQLTQAIAGLQALLAQDSQAVSKKEIKAWLAAVHIGNRDTSLGTSEIAELLSASPEDASKVHLILARQYRRQSKFDEAISELQTALTLNTQPKDDATVKSIRRYLMVCYASKGDLPNALAQLHIIMNDYPDEVMTFIIGEAERWNPNLSAAIDELKKTAEALPKDNPNSEILKRELAKCNVSECVVAGQYLDSKQYIACSNLCKDIIAADSDTDSTSDAMVKLAESMYLLDRGAEGLAFQKEFYAKRPDRKQEADWVSARTAYYAERDYAKAAEACEQFIAEYPQDPTSHEAKDMLVDSWEASGQLDKANRAIEESMTHAGPVEKANLTCRQAKILTADQPAKAREILNKLITDNPTDERVPVWQYRLAMCSYAEKNWVACRDSLKLLCDQNPDNAALLEAQYVLGDCYFRTGDPASARKVLQALIESSPHALWANAASVLLAAKGGNSNVSNAD